MANHPHRSCAQAHRAVFVAATATATLDELRTAHEVELAGLGNQDTPEALEETRLRLDVLSLVARYKFRTRID